MSWAHVGKWCFAVYVAGNVCVFPCCSFQLLTLHASWTLFSLLPHLPYLSLSLAPSLFLSPNPLFFFFPFIKNV